MSPETDKEILTKREQFAISVLHALIIKDPPTNPTPREQLAIEAIKISDVLIAELK